MKPSKFENYPITGICPADLEHSFFDISDVDDTTMKEIAERIELQYCDHFFWNSLKEIAESLNIKKSTSRSPPSLPRKEIERAFDLVRGILLNHPYPQFDQTLLWRFFRIED